MKVMVAVANQQTVCRGQVLSESGIVLLRTRPYALGYGVDARRAAIKLAKSNGWEVMNGEP